MVGYLSARIPELLLENLEDPRNARGKRWPLSRLLSGVLVGMVAGCKSLAQVEALTDEMSGAASKRLGLGRCIPDTTMRDTLVGLEPKEVRKVIHAQTRAAHRRKALEPVGLPFGVVSMDGKATQAQAWDDTYAQRQTHSDGKRACGVVRTMTCTLVSSRPRACIDAIPIPASTNEMGQFKSSLKELIFAYGGLNMFKIITYDAGACSLENANAIIDAKLEYLLRVNENQPTLHAEAKAQLGSITNDKALAMTEDVLGSYSVIRRVFLSEEMAGYMDWEHLRTVVRIRSEKVDETGQVISHEDRYYASSMEKGRLLPEQWLLLVRSHWGVENNCHNTFDTALCEDDRPWIEADPKGMVVVLLLRRIAYNLLSLFRSVTQRSEDKRQTPWADLLRWFYNAFIASTEEQIAALRPRLAVEI